MCSDASDDLLFAFWENKGLLKQPLLLETITYAALPNSSSTLRLQVSRSEAERGGQPLLSHLGLVINNPVLQGKQSSGLCSQERGQRSPHSRAGGSSLQQERS